MSVAALQHLVENLVTTRGWRHHLGENALSAEEMASPDSALPLLVYLGSKNSQLLFGTPLGVALESSDQALLGVKVVDMPDECPAATLALVSDALFELNKDAAPDLMVKPATYLDAYVQEFIDAMGRGPYQNVVLPHRVQNFSFSRSTG